MSGSDAKPPPKANRSILSIIVASLKRFVFAKYSIVSPASKINKSVAICFTICPFFSWLVVDGIRDSASLKRTMPVSAAPIITINGLTPDQKSAADRAERNAVFKCIFIKPFMAGHGHLFDICNHGRTAKSCQAEHQE